MKQENREKLQMVRGSLKALKYSQQEHNGMSALFAILAADILEVLNSEDGTESEAEECNA